MAAGVEVPAARTVRQRRVGVLLAFALAVMGDPVSSVAYAVEAGWRALRGDWLLLLPAMGAVVGLVALVDLSYHHLLARHPQGGGAAAAAAEAFGPAWACWPLAAMLVDYALTIALGVTAAAAALIAYLPALAGDRLGLSLGLAVGVAALTLLGHGGRAGFAVVTLAFLALAAVVLAHGFAAPGPVAGPPPPAGPGGVLLAFPVALAFATGTEAPASAMAQLRQLDRAGRVQAARCTLWGTLGVVGTLTLLLALQVRRLALATVPRHATLVAVVAAAAVGHGGLFAAFQGASALMLLAAGNSGYSAGAGLLQALARPGLGVLPRWLGRANRHHTPHWGVCALLAAVGLLVIGAGAHPQLLVLFYAVAVLLAFLFALLALARCAQRERRPWRLALHIAGAVAVSGTLVLDVLRLYPLVPLAAVAAGGGLLYLRWVRAGRPGGLT